MGQRVATLMVAVGIAMLPKCPICLTAYLGFFGALGLSASPGLGWLWPFLIVALIAGVGATGIGARQRRGYGPCLIATCASVTILVGKSTLENPLVAAAGVAALAVAMLWDRWPVRIRSTTG